jgi:hypothetical protein
MGQDDIKTLGALGDFAKLLLSNGKYEEARDVLKKCLKRQFRVYGEDHEKVR